MLSSKPLSQTERSLLENGPNFAPTPAMIPTKEIVCEIEAAVGNLPDVTKDSKRTTAAYQNVGKSKNQMYNACNTMWEHIGQVWCCPLERPTT